MTCCVAMVARAVGVDPAVAAVDAPGSAGATAVGVRLVVVMQAIKTVGHAYVVDWVTLVAGTIAVHVARKVGPTLKRTVQSAVHEWFGAILDAIATAWRLALRACADAALAIGGLRTVAAVGTWIGANGSAVDVSFTAVGDAILTGWRGARSTLTGGVDAVAMSPTAVTVGAQVWASRSTIFSTSRRSSGELSRWFRSLRAPATVFLLSSLSRQAHCCAGYTCGHRVVVLDVAAATHSVTSRHNKSSSRRPPRRAQERLRGGIVVARGSAR